LKKGDLVRIKIQKKNKLDKSLGHSNYTEEIYKVTSKRKAKDVSLKDTYKVASDENEEPYKGKTLYRDDLLLIPPREQKKVESKTEQKPALVKKESPSKPKKAVTPVEPPRRTNRVKKPVQKLDL
jgi:hypothetical protein